jgi:DNA-binding PadR family transcriptional regulator
MKKSSYGYNLIDNLANNGIFVEANTLYPLLRRLKNQGLIQGTWNTEGTKPRKYYIITEMGEQALELMNKHWKDTIKNINSILEGSSDD